MEFDRTEVVVGSQYLPQDHRHEPKRPPHHREFRGVASLPRKGPTSKSKSSRRVNLLIATWRTKNPPSRTPALRVGTNKLGSLRILDCPFSTNATPPAGYVFARPGEYIVSARTLAHHHARQRAPHVYRNPTDTHCCAGTHKAGPAEAFRLIEGKDYALALRQRSRTAKILNAFTTVAEKFADTPYAPMCAYAAGSAKTLTQKGQQEGIKMLREFARRWPNHPFYGNAIYNIFYTYHMSGNLERAQEWFYYLLDTDPHHRLMREENKLAAYYYYGRLEEAAARRWWLYEKPWALPRQTPNPQ